MLDSTPGGNGLSEALLTEDRMKDAFQKCMRTLGKFTGKNVEGQYERYILSLCHRASLHPAEEVLNGVRELHMRWTG